MKTQKRFGISYDSDAEWQETFEFINAEDVHDAVQVLVDTTIGELDINDVIEQHLSSDGKWQTIEKYTGFLHPHGYFEIDNSTLSPIVNHIVKGEK